ncbi:MAG TPA: hypothetical protein VIG97_07405 [Luteimonas sp.]
MVLHRASGGTRIAMKTVRRREKGVMVDMQFARRRQSGAWLTFWQAYQPLTLSATPVYAHHHHAGSSRPPALYVVSGVSVLTISGGSGALSVSAALLSGEVMTVDAMPESVTFSATISANTVRNATYRITVTDGISIATATVTVMLEYTTK